MVSCREIGIERVRRCDERAALREEKKIEEKLKSFSEEPSPLLAVIHIMQNSLVEKWVQTVATQLVHLHVK